MADYLEAKRLDLRRRRRERYLIISLFVVIVFLTFLGRRVFDVAPGLPFSSSILVFIVINVNIILLLLLIFLTVRNLVKLLFERRKNIMGAKLRTKLVMAFVTLSLLPTIILFFVSMQFISLSIEYWFQLQIEQSLEDSLEVGRDHYVRAADEIFFFGNNLSRVISYQGFMLPDSKERLEKFIDESTTLKKTSTISVYRTTLKHLHNYAKTKKFILVHSFSA